jgi:glucose-6-phosphate dehydrogenase assembly protein OpcA
MAHSTEQFIDPEAIERELAEIWATIDGQQEKRGIVTRASMSNVMIVCEGEDQALDGAERIPLLVQHHPARVLVLTVIDDQENDDIQAWVSAHCRRIDADTQLCAEHIELRFRSDNAARAASVVRSLLISDLPTALWWLSTRPPALTGPLFDAFAPMANQIIYDSVGWSDPARGVQAMARWSQGGHTVLFNLAWRRLKPWRRILSQSLAPTVLPGVLGQITEIELDHGPHALPLAWLLIGWLASRLGWRPKQGVAKAGNRLAWQFDSSTGSIGIRVRRADQGPPNIENMRIAWRGTQSLSSGHADYRHDGHHIRHFPGDEAMRPSSIPVVEQRLEQMVAAQLAHRAGDSLFTKALEISESMARVVKAETGTSTPH